MSKPLGTLESRKANACFQGVALQGLGKLGGWKASLANGLVRSLSGGDWIGGHVHITPTHLHFAPDLMHRMAVKDAAQYETAIALSEVTGLSTRWILAQKAIDLTLAGGGVFSVQCEGATALAGRLEAYVKAARA